MSNFTLRKDPYGAADAIQRNGVTLLHLVAGTQVNADNAGAFIEEANALAREAAAFRWLAAQRIEVQVERDGSAAVFNYDIGWIDAPTLLEACEKAMAAEGGVK